MHHPTDRITHTTAFVTPVVEHWLEREIAQWVHSMKDRSDDPSHHERTLLPRSYISLPKLGRMVWCWLAILLAEVCVSKDVLPNQALGLVKSLHYEWHISESVSNVLSVRGLPLNPCSDS